MTFPKKTLGTDDSEDEDVIVAFCKESNKIKKVRNVYEQNIYSFS